MSPAVQAPRGTAGAGWTAANACAGVPLAGAVPEVCSLARAGVAIMAAASNPAQSPAPERRGRACMVFSWWDPRECAVTVELH